jgi:plasmid stabilization system protein ParE
MTKKQYRTPNVSVGTVKKSIAAMASRWFLRNVSHRFTGCGSFRARRIREIENWWRRNRTASPDLFADELAATFDILEHAPHIGRLYRQSPVPDTLRVLLKGTRYHVYYVSPGVIR